MEEAGEPPTMDKQLVNFITCTLFCNLQSRARTHAVLVIGLYELLGKIGICCFYSKYAALSRKSKDWLAVSEWDNMSTRGLLFQ